VNDIGVTQWSAAGLAVCTAAGNQYAPAIVSDGAGGAVVVWQDDRAFPIDEIFMARIGAGGHTALAQRRRGAGAGKCGERRGTGRRGARGMAGGARDPCADRAQ
jgi:hypothetical protein